MGRNVVRGSVIDLEIDQASSEARHAEHLGDEFDFGDGLVAQLVTANGAVTLGDLCGLTGTAFAAESLTTAIIGALSDARTQTLRVGLALATATTGQYFFLLRQKLNSATAEGSARSAAAITAGVECYSDTTAGRIGGTAGVNFQLHNFEVVTDPAGAATFTAFRMNNPTVTIAANVALTQTYTTADATLAATTAVALTDSGTGTDLSTIAAGVGVSILAINLPLVGITGNVDVVTTYTPGYKFKILSVDFALTKIVSTGGKAATLNLEIGTTDLTGGVLSLTSANQATLGIVTAGTAVTANNTGSSAATISVEATGVTAFSEGDGTLLIRIQNMDVADAFAAAAVEITALIADINDAKQFVNSLVDALQAGSTIS